MNIIHEMFNKSRYDIIVPCDDFRVCVHNPCKNESEESYEKYVNETLMEVANTIIGFIPDRRKRLSESDRFHVNIAFADFTKFVSDEFYRFKMEDLWINQFTSAKNLNDNILYMLYSSCVQGWHTATIEIRDGETPIASEIILDTSADNSYWEPLLQNTFAAKGVLEQIIHPVVSEIFPYDHDIVIPINASFQKDSIY